MRRSIVAFAKRIYEQLTKFLMPAPWVHEVFNLYSWRFRRG